MTNMPLYINLIIRVGDELTYVIDRKNKIKVVTAIVEDIISSNEMGTTIMLSKDGKRWGMHYSDLVKIVFSQQREQIAMCDKEFRPKETNL